MFWFKHKFSAFFSYKQKALRVKRGRDDTNIFWYIIEYLANDNDNQLVVDPITMSIIASDLIMDIKHIEGYIDDAVEVDLFSRENNVLWSNWLNEQLDSIETIRLKRIEAGRIGGSVSRKGSSAKPTVQTISKAAFNEDDIQMIMAKHLATKITEISETAKVPSNQQQWQNWADTFDKIRRIDFRTDQQIHDIIDFATKDTFWQSNILAPTSLRKNFDRLVIQANRKLSDKNAGPKPKARKKLN